MHKSFIKASMMRPVNRRRGFSGAIQWRAELGRRHSLRTQVSRCSVFEERVRQAIFSYLDDVFACEEDEYDECEDDE